MNSNVLVLANVVSIITIALSFILKVPQIIRLYKAGTSVGLSLGGLLLELSSYTTTMMYNYTNGHAILTYLEYPILIIQDYIIIALVLRYKGYRITNFIGIVLLYSTVSLIFANGILSKTYLSLLLPCTVPAGVLSKGMQLMEIIRRKNADSVSTLTWFLSVFTNVTRIFTVYVDSADTTLLANFSISSVCSLSVLLAAIYYQRLSKAQSKRRKSQ